MFKKSAIFLFIGLLFGLNLQISAQPDTIKVMAWNILHGANDIPDGRYHAIDIIRELDPDIILMVETYGSGQEIADSLGLNFHLIAEEGTAPDDKSVNLSIFSKFPFGERYDTDQPFFLGGREVLINGRPLRLFSNWFYYLPWHDAPETMGLSAAEILQWEKEGKRWEMQQAVLPCLQQYAAAADSIPVIIGGDMNTPSHLDWGASTKAQHNGLIVPWQVTTELEKLGLIDSYRTINPDVLKYPGITWDVKGKKDEHRIDYIYYKGPGLRAIASESYKAHLGEMLTLKGKEIPYPSDHGLVLTTFVVEQPQAKGVVYLDANENGRRDTGEAGIAGVKVSNGVAVVETNSKGEYAIALPPESTLFISKPAGYTLPLNEVQLPQFYYHHYPDGTPRIADWKWPVIQSTGPLPETIDFALLEGKVPDTFKAMGFADPQTTRDEELDMLRKDVIDALFGNPHEAEFGLVAGDVVNDNLALYERHNRLMAQIGIPIYNVPGNHDTNPESPNYKYSTQTFKSIFGPDYYSFDYGQVHFLALNNVGFKGKGKGYIGHIDEQQMQWIENDLKDVPTDRLIIILTHIPLITYANNRTFPSSINTTNFKELLRILSRFQYIYTMAGHDTSNSWKVEVNHTHGWHGAPFIAHTLAETRGSGWRRGPRDERGVRPATMEDGNPNGYYVFYFDGHQVRPRFIPAGGDPTDRLRITLDPPLVHPDSVTNTHPLGLDRGRQQDSTLVVVNFFDGGVRDQVHIALDGAAPVPMEYIERTDPFSVRQYQKYKGTGDDFPEPVVSSHIWQFPLPKLAPGVHAVVISVKDEFGFEDREVLTFEVME